MADHVYKTSADCGCRGGNRECWVCDGGLSICRVCGLHEGGLTTECPGKSSYDKSDAVYRGLLDYRRGRWIEAVSCHSPVSYLDKRGQAEAIEEARRELEGVTSNG